VAGALGQPLAPQAGATAKPVARAADHCVRAVRVAHAGRGSAPPQVHGAGQPSPNGSPSPVRGRRFLLLVLGGNMSRVFVRSCILLLAIVGVIGAVHAQTLEPIMPKLPYAKGLYLKNNPAALADFMSRLPRRPAMRPPPVISAVPPPFGGTWQTVAVAPDTGLSTPMLLSDGTVIVHVANSNSWFRLTPDNTGSYVNGTWSSIASMPPGYGPQYFASAVLPDGRVIVEGGEYNMSSSGVWTNLGAIYDPLADAWTQVAPPNGGVGSWTMIGDAQSVVLANGTFMMASCCADPAVDALFNPTTLTWTQTGGPLAYQDEQGYELLPNGSVLTIDVWDPPAAETYNPATGAWSYIASTPVSLVDPTACGSFEIGPAVLRPDGTLVAFGGNTGCVTTSPADPTAIYNTATGIWATGPNVPQISGSYFSLADAPAALLPNGNILFAASPGFAQAPTHFFEFTSATSSPANFIQQVSDTVFFASSNSDYYYNFLVLPTGQILATDFSNTVEIYTPTGSPNASWAPTITSFPSSVIRGQMYVLSGTQLNGLSQGASYGDDNQPSTNYPLVRITNAGTGHVFYARTANFSTMSVAPLTSGSANVTVPGTIETGASSLVVVTNGIPSAPVAVTISAAASPTLLVSPTSTFVAGGPQGGPSFFPAAQTYTLTNSGSAPLNFTVGVTQSWLTLSTTGGTIPGGGSTTVTATINANATLLAPASHSDNITFTNTTSGVGNTTVPVLLNIMATSTSIVAAVLPYARSVQIGNEASAFAAIINAGTATAQGCGVALPQNIAGSFLYQTTNSSNQLTGTPNTPANIDAGQTQHYVFGIVPSAVLNSVEIQLIFSCANSPNAPSIPGVDTFILSASTSPTPDVVAIGVTPSGDGIVHIPGNTGTGVFATAAINIGVGASITASPDDDGEGLPVTLYICQTDSQGNCITPLGPSTTTTIANNAVVTYTILAVGSGNIAVNPATNRLFLRLKDAGGVLRGATDVAVQTN
jgi:hypothetical protein